MNLRQLASCALLVALAALGGCDQGTTRPGQVTVRVVNVASSFADLTYQRERPPGRLPPALGFKGADAFTYDAGQYDLYVYGSTLDPTVAPRTWTFDRTFNEDHDYTIVLTDDGNDVNLTLLEYTPADASNTQMVAFHAGGNLPSMDLYVVAPGAGIVGAAPRGTLAPFQGIAPFTLASGDYEIWLTAAGNPADVLFTSTTIGFAAAETASLIVTPEAGQGTEALSVALVRASPAIIYDRDASSEVRVINGAADGQPRDFVLNGEFAPPVLPAVPFAVPTSYIDLPFTGSVPINVTPAGNPGVIELDQLLAPVTGARQTLLFAGDAGTLTHVVAFDDGRRILNEAKVRFFNAATQLGTFTEFLLLPADADPTQYGANAAVTAPGYSVYLPFSPGDYDFYLRQTATDTILFGPLRVTLAGSGLYSIMAINNSADPTLGDVVLLDDFP
jgi:hypothetical protein